MYPTREKAEALLAERIAQACPGMDDGKAYIMGLLHDIGRKFGVKHLGHVYDGWKYMSELGYDEAARICLSHSFNEGKLENYIGKFDISEEQTEELRQALSVMEFDEYDRLIQLCDSLAAAEGVVDMKDRMEDIRRRYGQYPQSKWDKNMELKAHFEQKAGADIYAIVGGIGAKQDS